MENLLQNPMDIIEYSVPGYHQYVLSEPVHLNYVSEHLCRMTGYSRAELLSAAQDGYARLVHSGDKKIYSNFIESLTRKEQTLTAEYRLVRKDGAVVFVRDTMTSKRNDAGVLTGDSVLTDITAIKNENNNLQFLNSTIPCGFLKYTCEKQPKITYINQQMLDFLRFPEGGNGELDYLEIYKNNIFLMIPMEERRRFSMYLNRVYSAGEPIAGEMPLIRCDGTRMHVFGWVTKSVNARGVAEFQSVCMDITERQKIKKETESKRYIKALSDVYEKIFEYDLGHNMVQCLFSNNSPSFKIIENIPMQMEEATEKWITNTVIAQDHEKVKRYFKAFTGKKLNYVDGKPPQIQYSARSSSGDIHRYSGVFLKIKGSVYYYCVRKLPDSEETTTLKIENEAIKENMQELMLHFTDGVAAFEIKGDYVTPLYASDNVVEFFGSTKEEWYYLMRKETPIKEFVANSDFSYEEFDILLRNGEAEFTYFDVSTGEERRIKAICSTKSVSGMGPRFVLLYNVSDEKEGMENPLPEKPEVVIRTFGYFDVFVGERPISFRNKKSKELFALLVDRKGGYVSSNEAIGFLWEDEPVNAVTLSRYRKVALRLKNILEEYGISDIVESTDGNRRIVKEKVQCDLYDYLSGREEYSGLFKGSYLTNYSWGETTLAELSGNMLY